MVQQFHAMREGQHLYNGGWTRQPLDTLATSEALIQVRALYLELSKEKADWSKLSSLQFDLHKVVTDG